MNHPLTAKQFARLKEERTRKVRELGPERFTALKEQRAQTWAALSRDEQAMLVEQRRMMLPTGDEGES